MATVSAPFSTRNPAEAEEQKAEAVLATILKLNGDLLHHPDLARLIEFPECWDDHRHGTIAKEEKRLRKAGKPSGLYPVRASFVDQGDKGSAVVELLDTLARNPGLPLGLAEYDAQTMWERFKGRRAAELTDGATKSLLSRPDLRASIWAELRSDMDRLDGKPTKPLPLVRPWIGITADNGNNILIGPGRWVCRGAGVFVIGYSGAGKSTWTATQAFWWAIGRESLGLKPTRPLRSVIFQAEDDDGDLEEMRQGVLDEMQGNEAELELVRQNVLVVSEKAATGLGFLNHVVDPILRETSPDLVWLNPLSSYFGDDLKDQRAVASFFRNRLNPLLAQHKCAGFVIHHENKPTKDRKAWSGMDLSYAGAGSADLSNWAREVIVLKELKEGLFEMTCTKRWRRLKWTDADGKPTRTRLIAHGHESRQVWRDASDSVLDDLGATRYSDSKMIALVPDGGIDQTDLIQLVVQMFTVGDRTARRYITSATRPCTRIVEGAKVSTPLLNSAERPRREVYPGSRGRNVVWITKSSL